MGGIGASARRKEAIRPAAHLLSAQLLDPLTHHPLVPKGVAQAPGALAVELIGEGIEHLRPGFDRPRS